MKLVAIPISLLITISSALAEERPDFSGAWKRDCEKTYGLKISRTGDDQFAVALCFPAGCNDHPLIAKTPIAGDPKFRVVTESEIGLRRVDVPDAWLTYHRCSRDPASWDATSPAERLRETNADPQLK